jgi:hypothetical protein
MSPIIGLFVALIAAWLATGPRAAAAMVVPPMLGATAAQSWYLGTGRGHNSAAQTTNSPAYWVVQVIIIVAVCGVAAGACWLRMRRTSVVRTAPSRPVQVTWLIGATLAGLGATLGLMFVTDRPRHPQSGNGNPPIAGLIAIVVGLVVLVVLAVGWWRQSRQSVGHEVAHEVAR